MEIQEQHFLPPSLRSGLPGAEGVRCHTHIPASGIFLILAITFVL